MRCEIFKIFETCWCIWEKLCNGLAVHLWWIFKTVLTRLRLQIGEHDESNENEEHNKAESNSLSLNSLSI